MGGRGSSPIKYTRMEEIQEHIKKERTLHKMRVYNAMRMGSSSGLGISVDGYKPCACCGEYTIHFNTEYEKCYICGWIDDHMQNNNPDDATGRNPISLNEARKLFREGMTSIPNN